MWQSVETGYHDLPHLLTCCFIQEDFLTAAGLPFSPFSPPHPSSPPCWWVSPSALIPGCCICFCQSGKTVTSEIFSVTFFRSLGPISSKLTVWPFTLSSSIMEYSWSWSGCLPSPGHCAPSPSWCSPPAPMWLLLHTGKQMLSLELSTSLCSCMIRHSLIWMCYSVLTMVFYCS